MRLEPVTAPTSICKLHGILELIARGKWLKNSTVRSQQDSPSNSSNPYILYCIDVPAFCFVSFFHVLFLFPLPEFGANKGYIINTYCFNDNLVVCFHFLSGGAWVNLTTSKLICIWIIFLCCKRCIEGHFRISLIRHWVVNAIFTAEYETMTVAAALTTSCVWLFHTSHLAICDLCTFYISHFAIFVRPSSKCYIIL